MERRYLTTSSLSTIKSHLQFLTQKNLEPELAKEVKCTLETPRFRRVKRVEARRYISVYEKKGM
jgi:hypothetical protein